MPKTSHNFMALRSTDFIAIYDWMGAEGGLALKPTELRVYALIYSFSGDVTQGKPYYGSIDYTAARLNISKTSAKNAMRALVEAGLVVIYGTLDGGVGRPRPIYIADPARAEEAIRAFDAYWAEAGRALERRLEAGTFKLAMAPARESEPIPAGDTTSQLSAFDEACDPGTACEQGESELGQKSAKLSEANVENTVENPGALSELGQNLAESPGELGQNLAPITKGFNKSNQPTCATADAEDADPDAGRTDGEAGLERTLGFDRLVDAADNRNYLANEDGLAKTRAAYHAVLDAGYSAEEVCRAFEAVVADQRRSNIPLHYRKQLFRWLRCEAAAACRARRAQAGAAAARHRAPEPGTDAADAAKAELEERDPVYAEMAAEYRRAMTEACKAACTPGADAAAARRHAEEIRQRNERYAAGRLEVA